MKIVVSALIIGFLFLNPVQAQHKVILDTDPSFDPDDVGCMAMLHNLASRGVCEILAIINSTDHKESSLSISAINYFYNRGAIAVGDCRSYDTKIDAPENTYPYHLARTYPRDLSDWEKAPEGVALYREILASAAPHSITVIIIGTMHNFYGLLRSTPDDFSPLSGVELVREKVRLVATMGGNFIDGSGYDRTNWGGADQLCSYTSWSCLNEERNRMCRYVIEHCPAPFMASGWEVGCGDYYDADYGNVMTGQGLKQLDSTHIVRRSYEYHFRFRGGDDDISRHSNDQCALHFAVLGAGNNYRAYENGRIELSEAGVCKWDPDTDRQQGYIQKNRDKDLIAAEIEDLMLGEPLDRDLSPPTTPTKVSFLRTKEKCILTWSPSYDATIGSWVVGYRVYYNGSPVRTVYGTRFVTRSLSLVDQEKYEIKAINVSGVESKGAFVSAGGSLKILNFQADNGFQHDSKAAALRIVELIGQKNGWGVYSTREASSLVTEDLARFDVVLFNNNCGTAGPVLNQEQQAALQSYIRQGGGFVGIHCAGAIWKETGDFQQWYEGLIGTRLVAHPHVQEARLRLENRAHPISRHLPEEWIIKDEWHVFSENPRERVQVLLSLDESSYEAESSMKMGDHPFTWFQYYDGGRSFFTSLGHETTTYSDANFQQMLEKGIHWAGKGEEGLILDLDANTAVETTPDHWVTRWSNQVSGAAAVDFVPNDYGLRISHPGSGRPRLMTNLPELNGHNAIAFREDELINYEEDAFDHLITGNGYTWIAVLKPYATAEPDGATEFGTYRLHDVNSFMGNLRNGGNYEGLWGCFDDDLTFWCGTRNGITFGRFDANNPKLTGPQLQADKYHLLAARMEAGTGEVSLELFVDNPAPKARIMCPVNPDANSSKLAIGTERDANNHPGSESFDGEIARLLIYERPLTDVELTRIMQQLKIRYGL